jgi:hypothetical protein
MLYAAYGSNLHPVRLAERVVSARLIGTSLVRGWSLKCHKRSKDGSAKFNIVAGGEGVYVAVFEISADDKITLDNIEGVGLGYSTANLLVSDFGDCATYVAEQSYIDESLRPYEWYKKLAALGARAQGFPRRYQKMIDDIRTCEDPDKDRSEANWRIVEIIECNYRLDAHR